MLPSEFIERAITVKNDPRRHAWHYSDAKQILKWIETNGYMPIRINVFQSEFDIIKPVLVNIKHLDPFWDEVDISKNELSWSYEKDRIKEHKQNVVENLLNALQFLDLNNEKYGPNVLFEIFFETGIYLDSVEKEFFEKSIQGYEEVMFEARDAINIVKRYRELGKTILAIEAYRLFDDYTYQPFDEIYYDYISYENFDPNEYFERYHVVKNSDQGHWLEAEQWLKGRMATEWGFIVIA
jgi:hypothetical protein